MCLSCERLKARTIEPDSWFAIHLEHLRSGESFGHEPYPHPSGKWIRIVCPCGHKLITTEDEVAS